VRSHYKLEFVGATNKLIVGEGESDLKFFQAFCVKNGIGRFQYAFTGMRGLRPSGEYEASGFDMFKEYLNAFGRTSDFQKVTDIVLACDSGDRPTTNPNEKYKSLRKMIASARFGDPPMAYQPPTAANVVVPVGGPIPRVHILVLPWNDQSGGLETLCLQAARAAGGTESVRVMTCVDAFSNCVNVAPLNHERQGKFKLQSFISGMWPTRATVRPEQIYDMHASALVPLDHAAFNQVRDFLGQVAAL